MIISHKHKFIFIHCRKVAGSSITSFFSSHLAPLDLQIGVWADCYDLGILPNLRFFLDLSDPLSITKILSTITKRPNILLNQRKLISSLNEAHKRKYKKALGNNPPHPNAINLKKYNPQAWDEYFKFCFVRNPYERVVSDYLWRIKITKIDRVSFLEYLKILNDESNHHPIKPVNYDNWSMYTINNEIVVDFIGRYEQLSDDMAKVCSYLNIPFKSSMFPQAKKSDQKYDYRNWYQKEELSLVETIYAKEIEYFKYEF